MHPAVEELMEGPMKTFLMGMNYYFFSALLFCFLRIPNINSTKYAKLVRAVRLMALLSNKYSESMIKDDEETNESPENSVCPKTEAEPEQSKEIVPDKKK